MGGRNALLGHFSACGRCPCGLRSATTAKGNPSTCVSFLACCPSLYGWTIRHRSQPQLERDTILLDTVTGETWGLAQFTDLDGDPYGWQPIYKADTADGRAGMHLYYGDKPSKSPKP